MARVLSLQVVAAYHSKKGAAQGTFRLLYEGNVVKEDDTPDKVCPTCYVIHWPALLLEGLPMRIVCSIKSIPSDVRCYLLQQVSRLCC
jgi:hypothetical protein